MVYTDKLIRNQNFILTIGNKQRKLRCLRNGVPEIGLDLDPFKHLFIRASFYNLQKVCLGRLSEIVAFFLKFQGLGGTLRQDMTILSPFFQA